VEWSFVGAIPWPGLRLMGGVAWINAKVTRAASADLQGKQATGTPRTQAKLGVEWDAPFLAGLTLNANATGERAPMPSCP